MADISEITLGQTTYNIKDPVARGASIKEIVSVASGTTTLSAAVGKLYVVAGTVTSLTVTLPTITDTTKAQTIMMQFTTAASGTFDVFRITPPTGVSIQYYKDYLIEPGTSYEINCLFNGTKWIVAYGVLE